MKTCNRCKQQLPLSSFGKNTRSKDKLHYYCKPCTNKKLKVCARCAEHKHESCFGVDSRAAPSSFCKTCHPSNRNHYQEYKASALKRKIQWNLSEEEFYCFWQVPCYHCGSAQPTIGLDRENNREGYQLGNVVPCCTKCNYMKSVYSKDEWLRHSLSVLEFQGILRQEDTNMITTLGLESQRQAFDSLAALIPNLKDISVRKALYEVQSLLSIAVQETREEEKLRG